MRIFQVGVILGGDFPGGSNPEWKLSRWELSRVVIFFGGGFSGGNCPGRIIRMRKQPFADVLQNTEYGFLKIRNIHSKTQILIILFRHCY